MKIHALAAALLFSATLAQASDPESIDWVDLTPPFTSYENPFAALSSAQMNRLAHLLQLETLADTGTDATAAEDAASLREELIADGLDVEFLFAERLRIMELRTREATDPNAEIVGRNIRIPGYLLPLDIKDGRAVEFLLVPTVGACIHTPPPPANQIVHVSYPQGFEASGLYAPIWISGQIKSDPQEKSLWMVDGNASVNITYTMDAAVVEPYSE
ncbi:hypothetical protein shim_14380 [Shimia sp. SK013]|uniref:DUF3299 domain-containing protein n=1 Tax=Shimia sp. SK013 TaxID=1389006 RepID=UPI0006B5C754|nr:DUF3299 domain-containing protein [Shimia sp. SK013]KPA23143.1 hypothetical protein shim_14380 [Shimia sp. SK013]